MSWKDGDTRDSPDDAHSLCWGGRSLPEAGGETLEVPARRIWGSCAITGAGSVAHRAAERRLSEPVPCVGRCAFGGLFIPGLKKTIRSPTRQPGKRLLGSVGLAVPDQAAACRGAQATVAHGVLERCEELMAQEPMDGGGKLCGLEKPHLQRSWSWESRADAGREVGKNLRVPRALPGKGVISGLETSSQTLT